MNRNELAKEIAERTGLAKDDVDKVIRAFTEVVADELARDGKVQMIGFGTFETSKRAAHEGRNPMTGETIQVPASKTPKFKPGRSLKERVDSND